MNLVVDRLAQVLAATPNPVLATERVGTKTPAALADIPRVSVALELEPPSGTGIGRIAREGHIVTKHVQVVSIADPDSGFDESLTRWRLDPLPIKKNPDSPHRGLGGDDILVRNLATDTQYLFTEAPEEQTEFRFDPNGAVLVFGRAQATGESLEVQHWTLTLRDDIVPERYPDMNSGEDMTLDNKMRAACRCHWPSIGLHEITYLFRWANGHFHLSGFGPDKRGQKSGYEIIGEEIERKLAVAELPSGDIELKPHLKHDYYGMVGRFLGA